MKKTILKEKIGEVVRFGFAGGINTLLAYGVYSFFVFMGFPYYVALVFDYLFSILFSLFVNFYFTFHVKIPLSFKMFCKMMCSYCVLFILNEILLFVFISKWQMDSYAGQALASVIIAGVSYCLQKKIVFKDKGDTV